MAESSLPAAPRQRRKWRWIALLVLGAIILLILVTPMLLSTGPGNRWLLGMANGRIAGQIQARSLSLGWLSGIKVEGLKILDPQGQPVATIDTIDTQLTLLGALSSHKNLGAVHISTMKANLVTGTNGLSNLQHALASRSVSPASEPASAAPAASPAKESKTLPVITGDIVCDGVALSIQKPDRPATTINAKNINIKIDTTGDVNIDAIIKGLAVAQQDEKNALPPTDVSLKLAGQIDMAKGEFLSSYRWHPGRARPADA